MITVSFAMFCLTLSGVRLSSTKPLRSAASVCRAASVFCRAATSAARLAGSPAIMPRVARRSSWTAKKKGIAGPSELWILVVKLRVLTAS